MQRRSFFKRAIVTASAATFTPTIFSSSLPVKKQEFTSSKILNAYYFRAHTYTLVPKHVREDMKWMADIGTNVLSVAVLEQDLYAAVENINIIINEASKVGMKVYAVPSRWAGIVAGAPKVPSLFTIRNPQTWMIKKDGTFVDSSVSGRISSIFHVDTFEYMKSTVEKMLLTWPFAGVIWDEPKTFMADYSPMAKETLGLNPPFIKYIEANVEFYSKLNNHIKTLKPEIVTSLFLYANMSDEMIKIASTIRYLDYFGCDGRPWTVEDGGQVEDKGKNLLGNGERFITEARNNNKKTVWLIENHNMLDKDIDLIEKRMPQVLLKDIDQLIYYYYPRNLQTPDLIMNSIAKFLKKYRI